jgi:hypothetical protein
MDEPMEVQEEPEDFVSQANDKFIKRLGLRAYQGIFNTLLGCSDNLSAYVLVNSDARDLPVAVKYSLVHMMNMLNILRRILQDDKEGIEMGGYFPSGEGAWKSEGDFEKRFILLVKLYYNHLKKEGKL